MYCVMEFRSLCVLGPHGLVGKEDSRVMQVHGPFDSHDDALIAVDVLRSRNTDPWKFFAVWSMSDPRNI